MARRPGRPRLDPGGSSTTVSVRLATKHYDALLRAAERHATTVSDLIRRALVARMQPRAPPDRSE